MSPDREPAHRHKRRAPEPATSSSHTAERSAETSVDAMASERGATLFIIIITLFVLMLSGAFALDLSMTAARGQDLQNASDAASLAGVQALRGQGDSATLTEMQDAARLAVDQILVQNGIDLSEVTREVTFPDPIDQTEVRVNLIDSDPGVFFDGFTGTGSDLNRESTARFESCGIGCMLPIPIPKPVSSINVAGTGDGWTPLVVDHRVYALNHHSTTGYILCADMRTQGYCWGPDESDAGRPAYATGLNTTYTSDVPFAAIHDGVIYWTATNDQGSHVFCWQTATDTPCSASYKLTDLTSPKQSNNRVQPRLGGMVIHDEQLYVFDQDHKVHCILPTLPMSTCGSFLRDGEDSELALRNFPTNDPADGNEDADQAFTIVDPDSGRLYWLTEIFNTVGGNGGPNYALGQPTVQSSSAHGGSSGRAVDGNNSGDWGDNSITHTNDEFQPWWQVDLGVTVNVTQIDLFNRTNCCSDRLSDFHVFVSDTSMQGRSLSELLADASVTKFRELGDAGDDWSTPANAAGRYVRVQLNGTDPLSLAEVLVEGTVSATTFDPDYAPGTWIQCWDTNFDAPCSSFVASKLHDGASRFWGRPIIKRTSTGLVDAICVFVGHPSELPCVHPQTGAAMADFDELNDQVNAVRRSNLDYMGEVLDFQALNRAFIPASYYEGMLVCWDFATGHCGSTEGKTPLDPDEDTPPGGEWTKDYGYVPVGECVFGLGHTAKFWAFSANDIESDCDSSSTSAVIRPCPCAGELEWGTINFDVALGLFDRFEVRLLKEQPDGTMAQVYPVDGTDDPPPHSLVDDGTSIDLTDFPIGGIDEELVIEIFVQSTQNPWAVSEQVVNVAFERQPRLVG